MRVTEVRDYLRRQPFQPFRVCLSDGTEHRVFNPDWVFVTKNCVMVGTGDESEVIPSKVVYCDPLHITRLELVEPEPP
jgi:hypothetical protein